MTSRHNRPGYRLGFPELTGPDTWPVTDWDTGPVTDSLTDSPHVRAIASWPDLTWPSQTCTDPGVIPHNRDQQLNGNNSLSAVNAEVAGAREPLGHEKWCWACDAQDVAIRRRCWACYAPHWAGSVTAEITSGAGVYVIESDCGLAKIGMSRKGVAARVDHLINQSRNAGAQCWPIACLPGAGYAVERWLHLTLAETRDPHWARLEGLPHPSEWFWPTPALRGLVKGEAFVDALSPELIGGIAA